MFIGLSYKTCFLPHSFTGMGNKPKPHTGQCQYDFPLCSQDIPAKLRIFTSKPRKAVEADIDRDTLVCHLNSEHKMYLYKSWRENTLREMLKIGCLVGEAQKEAISLCSQDIPAKLLSCTDK
jgi:hypothetical protein